MDPFSPEILRRHAVPRERDDGSTYLSLSPRSVEELASAYGLPPREIEAQALDQFAESGSGIVPERYMRNLSSISPSDVARLLRARVLIIGLGGLGGYVLEELARLGVGQILGADGDVFEASNLNRQLLSRENALGRRKASLAAERVNQINTSVDFTPLPEFLDRKRLEAIIPTVDLVIDALGGLAFRLDVQEASAAAGIPLVTAAVAGWSGYAATVPPGKPGPASLMGSGGAAEDALGTPAPCVALAASLEASRAVRALTRPLPETTRAVFFDMEDDSFQNVEF